MFGFGPGARPGTASTTRREILRILVVAVLYYASARFSLRFALIERNITPLWPPTGIALVAFVRYGKRLWPGVMLGALLVNLPITNGLAALATSVGNTIAPLLAARLLEGIGFRHTIDRIRDVIGLVLLAALLSMTVSATVGTTSLVLSSDLPMTRFWEAWSVWWAGDAMGILVIAPFLLCLLTWRELRPEVGWQHVPEAALMFGLLLAASVFAVSGRSPLLFLIPPMVGWIAWRFQLRGAAPAVLLVSVVAVWAAVRMVGWFADLSLRNGMLTLQLFNATVAFTAFFVTALVSERIRANELLASAAVELGVRVRQRTEQLSEAERHLARQIAERREAEHELHRNERELAKTQELAHVGRWEWDLETGAVIWSDDMYRIHGYEPGAFEASFDKAVELAPEEDRRRIEHHLADALADRRPEVPDIEYRIVRPDDELRVLLGRGRLFLGPGETPTKLTGIVMDITERREYEHQHQIAETLQRALLPQDLPTLDGLALAANYVPAEVGFKAGGDWYDVIPFPDGRVGLVIGDVAGHGLEAASVMGQLRMAVRAFALEGHCPIDIVARADSVLGSIASEEFATMLYAELDVATGEARIVRAGHPPPLAITSRGAAYLDLPPDPPVGLSGSRTYREHAMAIEPGSTLVLFTDGLIDRRDLPLDECMRRLVVAAEIGRDRSVEELTRDLVGALVPGQVTDDVAVLAVQHLPVPVDRFALRVPAEPAELARVRRSFSRWLRGVGVDPTDVEELVLMCSEVCTNAVRHAYGPMGGAIEVQAEPLDGTIELTVRDFGRWRDRRQRSGGRGLAMVEALARSVRIDRNDGGTVVRICRDVGRSVSV